MRYLLDSDRLSDLYATDVPGHAGIARRLASLGDSDQVVLSILALYRQLSDKSIKAHNIDLMLAATAITEDCILLSGDSIFGDLQQFDPRLRFEKDEKDVDS